MINPVLETARANLYDGLRGRLWSFSRGGVPSNADKDNRASLAIGVALADAIGGVKVRKRLNGSAAGGEFERHIRRFVQDTFPKLTHMRPGKWEVLPGQAISVFEQYSHLSALEEAASQNSELAAALGSDYTIRPDVVIARHPETDDIFNENERYLGEGTARYAPLRAGNSSLALLHASISCKWTIRSDRSQNSRSEGLNLARNRKGRAPHIAVVTAEPLPSRLASIAIGTGDIDCTYHVALYELRAVLSNLNGMDDAREMLEIMVQGKRLRDISDLPVDLVV